MNMGWMWAECRKVMGPLGHHAIVIGWHGTPEDGFVTPWDGCGTTNFKKCSQAKYLVRTLRYFVLLHCINISVHNHCVHF